MNQVVITGMGVLSPNGIGRSEFKKALLMGQSGIRRIASFNADHLPSQIAGEIHLNGRESSKKEKRNLPRVVRFALLGAEEALEDAGLWPENLSKEERYRFGVMLGSGGGSVEFMERHYEMYYGDRPFEPSLYVVPASTSGGLSSEISIRFGFLGQSHVITTGCTSSTDAIGYGFREIQAGRLDCVIAGGADAPIAQGIMEGFSLMKILSRRWNHSPEKASRPFSKDRDGFVLAEGAWMFVLEEKNRALARGRRPYAEILGYGSSCEAFHAVSLDEGGEANLRAMKLAADEAGVAPEAIDYINLHGTSTVLNDRVETRAIKNFMGRHAYRIPMSSTKSMIGHPQGASGAAGIAATLLALEDKKVHPTLNLDETDPECDLDYVPHRARPHEAEFVLCNTLGFGSKCSALVLKIPRN